LEDVRACWLVSQRSALLTSLLLLDLLHDHALAHAAARSASGSSETTRQVLGRVLHADYVLLAQGQLMPRCLTKGLEQIFATPQIEVFALVKKRAGSLQEVAARVVVGLRQDNVWLRETSLIAVDHEVRWRMQVYRRVKQALSVLVCGRRGTCK